MTNLQPQTKRRAPMDGVLRHMEEQHIIQVSNGLMNDKDILQMWFGEGSQPTPKFIREAAKKSIDLGETFYSEKRGNPKFLSAIKSYHDRLYNGNFSLERFSVTSSGMSAIQLAFQAILKSEEINDNKGGINNIILIGPLWPNAESVGRLNRCETRFCLLESRDGQFHLDMDKLAGMIDDNTRAIFVNSPNNPSGWMIGDGQIKAILELSRLHNFWILADEVYNRITYSDKLSAPSFLEFSNNDDNLIVVNSFSKSYAMTGWRLGWMVHPEYLGIEIAKLIEFNFSCTPSFVQMAGMTALQDGEDYIKESTENLKIVRDILAEKLPRLKGVNAYSSPVAGFYAYFHVDFAAAQANILQFARNLAENGKVGLAPGSSFGPMQEGWLRLCFAQSPDIIHEALTRLDNYFNRL